MSALPHPSARPALPRAPAALRALALPVRAADRVRWLWLKALGPLAKPLVRDRELRVAVAGSCLIALAFLGAALVPMWMLALGPIVWGVPHVVGDVRYLAVRPGLHRRIPFWLAVVAPLLALSLTAEPTWGFLAACGAALTARGAWWRRLLVAAPVAVLAWLAHEAAFLTAVVFAHAHNFIGVGLFWSWRRRAGRLHWVPLALFAVGIALILGGALDPLVWSTESIFATPGGMDAGWHMRSLAPGMEPVLGVRLVLLFAFAQSVHYVVWVRLVPEEDRPRETPRTFRASLSALADDFGWPLLALTILGALGLAVWGALDVFAARSGYLRAVLFHGHLEVAAAALIAVEGTRPRARTGPTARG